MKSATDVMKARTKRLAREAFRAGALQGGDPFVDGGVPRDIERTIARSFAAWWKLNGGW